ncbi:MAG: SusD/RagB family nutrient-binding outer membrane lipoprotein, partial [Saprospiraceae bacterium]
NRDDFCVTTKLVEILNDFGDPRLAAYAAPNPSGEIVGMPSGLTDNEATELKPTCSRPSATVRTATAPAILMDYAEVSFLIAEAAERGIISGDAAAAYAAGISASMNYWGISDATAIDAYVAANPYDAANWKESIGTQKWLAFYMNGPQAWAEWRRLDFPVLDVPVAAIEDNIPVRLPYALSETSTNSSFSASNPNDIMTKMWWDMN